MRLAILFGIVLLMVQQSVAPPVSQNKEEEKTKENELDVEDEVNGIEYHRYLREVVETLETDPEFREKLQKANEEDIKSGKIALQLEHVNHHVRSKLDEIKRAELERLKHLVMRENELTNEHMSNELDGKKDHLDHSNPHTFEIEDLTKLIAKTTKDLAEADKKRREEFKEYEMQKKFEEEEKIKELKNEEERKKYQEELQKMKEKHKKHEPLHHPGSKQQLEEVWEKQDHMGDQEFNPQTFFQMHDVDGNGFWDQDEVKALFKKELDKMYNDGAAEDDLVERAEEMERMREHVFKEVDRDHNGVIDFTEFLNQARDPEFQKDPGWQPLDEQQIYTQEEYEAFERQRHAEMQRQRAQQNMPPYPGHHEQFPAQNIDPNQQHYQGQVPQQSHYPGQPPIHHQQQQYPGQVPVHPSQYHQGQVPVQQHYPGQVPPQQYSGQLPVQQQHPGQPPIQNQQQYQAPAQYVPRDKIPSEHQYQAQPNVNQQQNTQSQQINNQVNSQGPSQAGQLAQNQPAQPQAANQIDSNQASSQQNTLNKDANPAIPQVVRV